ncbi:Chromatin modification-related protein EAF5 [Nakaseomyces bracarensis]|uniref:Chromatin modification-related protein EAF5 n=1 Tax=Nakaseomyces bracarensis TaxID=273131 RepID=A0ABR4NX70_9SACH
MSELQTLVVYQVSHLLRCEGVEVTVENVMRVLRNNALVEFLMDVPDRTCVEKLVVQYLRVESDVSDSGSDSVAGKIETLSVSCRRRVGKEIDDIDVSIRNNRKKEKLLNLYRDTVLNRLQSKRTVLDQMCREMVEDTGVVRRRLDVGSIKNETPRSIAEFQLALQRSITDCLMNEPSGSDKWKVALEVQNNLDDTIKFMRRALE